MKVDFYNFLRVIQPYKEDIKSAVNEVIDSGWYIQGKKVEEFERAFADYCDRKYCIGVGNGLDALSLVLRGWLEMGYLDEGDEVIIPSNTFIATALAVTQNKLRPVFVNPSPYTYLIESESVKEKITNKTKVIIPVHLYGQMVDMDPLLDLAKRHDLLVLEDAAQAHGAIYKGSKAGSLGNAGCFSFYPTKNLGAIGDAGAIVTNDNKLAGLVRKIGNYGSASKYRHDVKGVNSRLDEIHAAMLLVRLKNIENEITERNHIATTYLTQISNSKINLPKKCNHGRHVWHLFVLAVNERESLINYLKDAGIATLIHYPVNLMDMKLFADESKKASSNSNNINNKVLSIPLFPGMTDMEIEKVKNTLNKW